MEKKSQLVNRYVEYKIHKNIPYTWEYVNRPTNWDFSNIGKFAPQAEMNEEFRHRCEKSLLLSSL
jgi:hypothetical protein